VNAARTSIGDAASRAETANIVARASPPRFSTLGSILFLTNQLGWLRYQFCST
jgi:hypothetical protein